MGIDSDAFRAERTRALHSQNDLARQEALGEFILRTSAMAEFMLRLINGTQMIHPVPAHLTETIAYLETEIRREHFRSFGIELPGKQLTCPRCGAPIQPGHTCTCVGPGS